MPSKVCKRCEKEMPLAEFRADPRYRDGLGSWCRPCHRERNSEWAKENRARLTAKAAIYRDVRPDVVRKANAKFKAENKDALYAQHVEWVRANRGKRRASYAARKSLKASATPHWSDLAAIAAIYSEAVRLQSETGQRLHVDHIVPITSPHVCGLHVPANLRIIPAAENESKRNFWWPDMPEHLAYKQPRLFAEPVAKVEQLSMLVSP